MPGYRSLRVSDETAFDLARALWVSAVLNDRDGTTPGNPQARQAEAFARIIREWSESALPGFDAPGFEQLTDADWQCGCGSTGINAGGLTVVWGKAWCGPCLADILATD